MLFAALPLAIILTTTSAALACWQTVVQECFERVESTWPWINPTGSGRSWAHSPGDPQLHWGPQDQYFNNAICPPEHDTQSCWIIGDPRTEDPEFDQYAPNLDTYMTYGPLNLIDKTAARVTFYLLNDSEEFHDSVYWGASMSRTLSATNMQVGGSFSGRPNPLIYQTVVFDLSNLRNYTTHDSISLLDSNNVFVFWRFKADNNNNRGIGAFVDEVVIRVDDGCFDLDAAEVIIHRADGRLLTGDPHVGDTLYAVMSFATCDGAVDATYPAFHVMGTVGADTILYEHIQGADRNQLFAYNSAQWVVTEPGDFNVRLSVDTPDVVTECTETNNAVNALYHVPVPNTPPVFTWLAPGTDTLFTAGNVRLRWNCVDPNEIAAINIHYDLDNLGCEGINVPGGTNLAEMDGPDSLDWDWSNEPEERTYYVYAIVTDIDGGICVYSTRPVVKRTTAAGDRAPGALPTHMYLAQNYPNPFNPATEISYGISKGGNVTLRVFDLLGREAATLVDRTLTPGHYSAQLNAASFSSGLYLYVLTTPEGALTRKMLLLK
jgi:hypothetical protein